MSVYDQFSDQELTQRFSQGDDAAFKEIYQRYDKLLYHFAYNKLRDEDEALDVVQDVFEWILSNRQQLALKTSLSSYLYKSVLNKIFDLFRHQNTIRKYISQGEHFIELDSTSTDDLIREKDIQQMIDRQIAAMPPRMQEIYLLKFKHHLTPKQIAEQLDVSQNTVNTQLKRAVKHLKSKLGIVIYVIYILHQ